MRGFNILVSALFASYSMANNQAPSFLQYQTNTQRKYLTDSFADGAEINTQPVVGILTQTLEEDMKSDSRFDGYTSYIMHSYVDFAMSSGARVVPMIVNEDQDVTIDKLSKINGVLMPGGDGDYLTYGNFIYDKIKEFNDQGTYYPLWTVCMGFENLVSYVSASGWDVLEPFDYDHGSLPLEFIKDPRDTQMFGWLQDQAFFFEDHNMTYNSHHWGVDPKVFAADPALSEMFDVTAVSYLDDGRAFVATIESEKYPFFGTQFHPEKTTQVYLDNQGIDHTWLGIEMNRVFTDYFVYLARHNSNSYGGYANTQKYIVQNYDTIVTDGYFGNVYVFK